VELQADMHSVRHRIDDPAGWEVFSLYSQQQADLEGRLRLVGPTTQPAAWHTPDAVLQMPCRWDLRAG
jgi:hypothetical protein